MGQGNTGIAAYSIPPRLKRWLQINLTHDILCGCFVLFWICSPLNSVVLIEGNLSIDEVHEQIVEAEVTRAAKAHVLTVNDCDRAPLALRLSLYFPRLKLVVMVNVPVS